MGVSKKVRTEVQQLEEVVCESAEQEQLETKAAKKQKKQKKEAATEADVEAPVENKKRKKAAEVEEAAVEAPVETKKRKKADKPEAEKAADAGASVEVLEADAYRTQMTISSKNPATELPEPVQTFDAAPFGKKMRNALKAAGFAAPTAIQAQGWPLAVRGDDMVSVAKTGSGKTLAFLLPIFKRISKEQLDPSSGPVALVLAPTRELATQIEAVAKQFGACLDISTATVYGGAPKGPQAKELKKQPHLVVATPGRLTDFMSDGTANLSNVAFLVLDEADRMLDMGFEPQMETIMKQMPAERQTLLFSATWPKAVQKLATKYLKSGAAHINVGQTEELAANKAVSQQFFNLGDDEKENKLWRLLYDMGEGTKIIIFANTKNRINKLQKSCWDNGYDSVAMHGDKPQWERDQGLAKFTSGEIPVMLATDVCARGLDIKDVSHVMNFDMARDVESYIHRIGRTGRAGKSGTSITFFNDAYDVECAPALAKIAREAGQEVPAFLEKAATKGANAKNKLWKY
eukprot:TRINITY_DN8921_c0_g1_i1.p1 TRINITY_DN8921_c0_g1~~TRINITY_DN8921_c0_g1_i1.p1  ORF type:complete len:518 (+),score=181.12 TRINITY_DN8921_c0_g1_i1:104-1657(+)